MWQTVRQSWKRSHLTMRKDSTSIERDDCDFTEALVEDVKGLRIGIPRDYLGEGLDPEVKAGSLEGSESAEGKRCHGRRV